MKKKISRNEGLDEKNCRRKYKGRKRKKNGEEKRMRRILESQKFQFDLWLEESRTRTKGKNRSFPEVKK